MNCAKRSQKKRQQTEQLRKWPLKFIAFADISLILHRILHLDYKINGKCSLETFAVKSSDSCILPLAKYTHGKPGAPLKMTRTHDETVKKSLEHSKSGSASNWVSPILFIKIFRNHFQSVTHIQAASSECIKKCHLNL